MTIPVFGLSAIKDKATRDAIWALAQRAGMGSGVGNANLEVQADDPMPTDPGEEGEIIYATGSESIWIFAGTEWERASSAESGVSVYINAMAPDPSLGQMTDWGTPMMGVSNTSPNFKNDAARTIGLVAHIYEGGTEVANSVYTDTDTTYSWTKNGATFTPNATQTADTGTDKRVVLINQDDVADGNINEVFTCVIDY